MTVPSNTYMAMVLPFFALLFPIPECREVDCLAFWMRWDSGEFFQLGDGVGDIIILVDRRKRAWVKRLLTR